MSFAEVRRIGRGLRKPAALAEILTRATKDRVGMPMRRDDSQDADGCSFTGCPDAANRYRRTRNLRE